VEDSRTGAVRVVQGEARLFLESFEKLLSGIKPLKAWTLSKTEYVRLKDSLTGATRVVRGEGLCVGTGVPGARRRSHSPRRAPRELPRLLDARRGRGSPPHSRVEAFT